MSSVLTDKEAATVIDSNHVEISSGFNATNVDEALDAFTGIGDIEWTADEEKKVVRKIDFVILPLVRSKGAQSVPSHFSQKIMLRQFTAILGRHDNHRGWSNLRIRRHLWHGQGSEALHT